MKRLRRLRAPATVLISVCLGLFAAAQSPATAAVSQTARLSPQTAAHQSAKAPVAGTRAASAKPAATATSATASTQDPDYKPAGCYSATPKPGTASCFALVRTTKTGGVVPGVDGPPATALTPADIQAAYHLPATGQGQTVAVVDAFGYSSAESDLAVFRQQYGLPACTTQNGCFSKVDQQGGTNYPADDSDWSTETALDLDAVSSACPACNILLVEANSNDIPDLAAAADTAVSLGAKFVSNSYGALDSAAAGQVSDSDYNHPGVVVTASTGDVGNQVEWPSSDPDVVAVGGTTLTPASGTSRGWSETAWSKAGSGCSSFEPQPVYQGDLTTDCANRATADISADADPNSGLAEYDTLNGGWEQVGGTSLASPLIASMYALAGTPAAGTYPVTYPYIHASSDLNDVTGGSNGTCGDVLCTAGAGWDGPTGLGTPNGVAALAMGSQGTVSGRITDASTGAPLAGVSVLLTDTADQLTFRAVTDGGGAYQVGVSAGTYSVSASKFDFGTVTVDGVAVAAGKNITDNLKLTTTPERTVTGEVTDAGNGWPLYAKITVAGDPNGPVFTDPKTGRYSIVLPERADYPVDVAPDYPGYAPSDTTVALGNGNLRHNVAVAADATGCTAPGYGYSAQADFDGWTTGPKYGWTVGGDGTSTTGWQFDNPGGHENLTGGTGGFATADPSDNDGVAEDTYLTSPVFSLAGQKNADLDFYADSEFAAGSGSEADASFSTDGGRTWVPVYQAADGADGSVDVPLTKALGHRDVQVRFHFSGQGTSLFQLSNVSVGRCQAVGGGLIEGRAVDANTHQPLNGATVTDTSAPVTDAYSTAVSASGTGVVNQPAGYYWLYSPKAGRNTVTTAAPRYTAVRTTVDVFRGVDTYNPVMAAGRLKAITQTVSLKTALGSKASQVVTLTNVGTAPLGITMEEQSSSPSASTSTVAGSGTWQSLPGYPEPVMDNVVGSYEGKTYSIGGTQNALGFMPPYTELVKQNYVYDPGAASWTQIADLPQYRTGATGAFVNGTLYVVGGIDYAQTGGPAVYESTTYAYHPGSDSWSQVADLPQALAFSNAAVFDGRLYVIGGRTAAGSSSAAYSYDPADDTWTPIADYPVPVDSGGCGGIVEGIVCAGGAETQSNGSENLSAGTYLYHPAGNTWTRGADMPYADYLGSYSSADGELQIAGGVPSRPVGGAPGATTGVLQYDPVADAWSALPYAAMGVFAAGRGTGCGLTEVGGATAGVSGGGTLVETLDGYDQCSGDDVPWLSESTTTVELAPGHSARVTVTADGRTLTAPGDYAAEISLITDSPYPYQPVQVRLQATASAS